LKDLDRVVIEKQCEQLVNHFQYLFNRELSRVTELMAQNGTLDFAGWKVGPDRDQMTTALRAGSRNMLRGKEIVLNTISNVVIDAADENHATGVAYDTMWETPYPDDGFAGRPAPIRRPKFLALWTDDFIRESEEWKFASRKMEVKFYADWARA